MHKAELSRRDFLKTAAVLPALRFQRGQLPATPDPWSEAATILGRIKEPAIPNRDFNLGAFN